MFSLQFTKHSSLSTHPHENVEQLETDSRTIWSRTILGKNQFTSLPNITSYDHTIDMRKHKPFEVEMSDLYKSSDGKTLFFLYVVGYSEMTSHINGEREGIQVVISCDAIDGRRRIERNVMPPILKIVSVPFAIFSPYSILYNRRYPL